MNTILIKIFAVALTLSQVTTRRAPTEPSCPRDTV
jgi:hypothetical protein